MPEPTPHHDVAGYVLGTLTVAEAQAFQAHLAGCPACQAEVAELGGLPALLRSAAPPVPPPLRQRTFAALSAASTPAPGAAPASGPGRAPGAAPGSGPAPASGPARPVSGAGPAPMVRPVTPLRPRRPAVRWLAAAAAALLVVAAVGIGAVLLTRGDTTTIALVAADTGAGSGQAVVRETGGGRQVELSVAGLPANPPGTYYECWFVGPGDTEEKPNRVSAGTFTVGADGRATVTMISAADLARFPRMGVTLEPDDGNPARTGPKYLVSG